MRLKLQGVRKVYGHKVALEELNLEIAAGEFVGLIGPNGAGKTTMMRILAGQLLPTSGKVEVEGVDVVFQPDAARGLMGLVPEEPALYDYLTAREFLEFVVGVRGKGAVEEALELSGLGVDADRLIREYSQGMRRRTALAAAVVSHPPLLVLDEAINGLDPVSADRVESYLQRRCAAGDAVLLSTHLLDAVEKVATRIVMLKGGRVVEDVQVAELGMEGVRGLFQRHMQ
jgi:ABC-2 type transport system ATP-binding protein